MSQKKTAGSSELRIRCDETLRRQLAEVARRSLRSMTPPRTRRATLDSQAPGRTDVLIFKSFKAKKEKFVMAKARKVFSGTTPIVVQEA